MIVCQKCKKEYEQAPESPCECGGRLFVQGNLKIDGDEIACECGSVEVDIMLFTDGPKTYSTICACNGCRNSIIQFGLRSIDSHMYHE